jgi:hypothetical protein
LLTNSPFWFFFFWKMSHSIPSIQEVNFMLSLFYVNWVTNGQKLFTKPLKERIWLVTDHDVHFYLGLCELKAEVCLLCKYS